MKNLYLTLLLILTSLSLSASVISPDEAIDRIMGNKTRSVIQKVRPKLVSTRMIYNQPAIYLFSNQDNNGFLVLSADDEVTPMLGYSDTGSFSAEDINPTMQWWLDEYAAEIQYMREHPQRVERLTTKRTEHNRISPLVTTKWNQGEPYNLMCPTNGTRHCVTGCVATAMAQVVNYHKWPVGTGTGSKSATYYGETYSFDYSSETFDWDNMLDVYTSGNYTTAQANAVAKLMFACGLSVDMNYGTGASGANTTDIAEALIDYFGYDKNITTFYRNYYHLDEWNELVCNQLTEYGPVVFSGSNDGGGHAFVCDGYDSNDYFHINWGWGGMSDGYFKLSALDPDSQGIGGSSAGYNSRQWIIANISTPREGSSNTPSMGSMGINNTLPLNVKVSEVSLGSNLTVYGAFQNIGTKNLNFDIGWRLTSVDSEEETYIIGETNQTLPPRYYFTYTYMKLPTTLSDGVYRMVPMWRETGTDQWNCFLIVVNDPHYIVVKVADGKAVLSVPASSMPDVSLRSVNTPAYIGKTVEFSITLANNTEQEYLGNIHAVLLSQDGETCVAAGKNVWLDIMPGQSVADNYTTSFTSTSESDITAGNYKLAWATSDDVIVSPKYDIEIKAVPEEKGTLTLNSFWIGDSNHVDAMDITFGADVTCESGYIIGAHLEADIYRDNGSTLSYVTSVSSPYLFLEPDESIELTFSGSLPNLEVGQRYYAYLYYYNTGEGYRQLSYGTPFTVSTLSAIDDIKADDNNAIDYSEAYEVYNLQGLRVGESVNNLAPGIYILRQGMKVTKIIVK